MPHDPPSLWTFTVIAALVTTAGTLLGHFLKEIILAKSFEKWRQRLQAESLFRKYRDPIVLSAVELAGRLVEILNEHPTDFLSSRLLVLDPPAPSLASDRDRYFQRYKCQSTIYRLAAFLGWLELYRQDLVYLDPSTSRTDKLIQTQLREVRGDLADGQLNTAQNWHEWSDALIFREEQRAVGEAMIVTAGNSRRVMGYAGFVASMEKGNDDAARWFPVASNFFVDPKTSGDFRPVRYKRLVVHLVELVQVLEQSRLPSYLQQAANQYDTEMHPQNVAGASAVPLA